jgi:hypothetical protein
VPIPVPSDLVMLLGERVSAGALPLWLAVAALELVALAGTAALFLAARGPARALLTRFGPGRALLARVGAGLGGADPSRTDRREDQLARQPLGPGPAPPVGERSRSAGGGEAAVHRVLPALVAGRTTPGLRTVTVVAAAGSGIRVGRALRPWC